MIVMRFPGINLISILVRRQEVDGLRLAGEKSSKNSISVNKCLCGNVIMVLSGQMLKNYVITSLIESRLRTALYNRSSIYG